MASNEVRAVHVAGHEAEQSTRHDLKAETHAAEGGMPQLNVESYAGQLFWFAVTFVLLYVLISKSALPRIEKALGERKRRIDEDLDRAEQMTQQADVARAAYSKLEAETRKRVTDLLDEAKMRNGHSAKAEFAQLDQTLSEKLSQATARIEAESQAVSKELAPLAKAVTAQIVAKLLGKSVESNAQG